MSARRDGDRRPVVIVTGASRGIGLAISERLAVAGWLVFAAARGTPTNIAARPARDAHTPVGELVSLHADVRDAASVRRAVSEALAHADGRLDAVVANAGIAAVGMFQDTPAEVMAALMETNYFGVLNTVRETLPALRAHHGRIVVISSDAAVYGPPGLSGYSASKFALEGWAESVAQELRPLGVRVSIIRPGAFTTDIWQSPVYLPKNGAGLQLATTVAASWTKAGATAADPTRVAATVEKALTANHPRLRYTVGNDARRAATLRRALPDSLFVRYVARANNLRQDVETTSGRGDT